MRHDADTKVECQICGQRKSLFEVLPVRLVRDAVADVMRAEHPELTDDGYVCLTDLNHYRMERVKQLVEEEVGVLSSTQLEVVKSLEDHDLIAANVNEEFEGKLTAGQKVADKVAEFGGSWPFIITFGVVLIVWITVNSIGLLHKPFDPFPYILLNLCLSCLAAIQAPVIMMSQNRQEAKDRLRAQQDYQVNLKAELEIRSLNARLEALLHHQWQGLLEIQRLQTEMMEELTRETGAMAGGPEEAVSEDAGEAAHEG